LGQLVIIIHTKLAEVFLVETNRWSGSRRLKEPGGLKPDWIGALIWFHDLKVVAMFWTLLPLPAHSEECGYQPLVVTVICARVVEVPLTEARVWSVATPLALWRVRLQPLCPLVIIIHGGFVVVFLVESKVW